jgi:hypothetical protein
VISSAGTSRQLSVEFPQEILLLSALGRDRRVGSTPRIIEELAKLKPRLLRKRS